MWYVIHVALDQGSLLKIFLTVALGHLGISVLAAPFKRLNIQFHVITLVPNKLNENIDVHQLRLRFIYANAKASTTFRIQQRALIHFYGIFTLPDTRTNKETARKWILQNNMDVFILHTDRHKHTFPLGSVLIYQYLCTSR